MRLDLHVHSRHSRDGAGSVLELARAVKRRGLDGFALTDHDTVAGHAEIPAAAQETGLLIVPGVEVTTAVGHLLAYGVAEAPPAGLPLADAVRHVLAAGGVPVAAHPLRGSGVGRAGLKLAHRLGMGCCETINSREGQRREERTRETAAELGLRQCGGSDAHDVRHAGLAWTELEAGDVPGVLEALRAGRCSPGGRRMGLAALLAQRVLMPARFVR